MSDAHIPLPAEVARDLQSQGEPQQRLYELRQDLRDTKAEIRIALERLAERHGIGMREVDHSMGWVDEALLDLVYETENEIEHELEKQERV